MDRLSSIWLAFHRIHGWLGLCELIGCNDKELAELERIDDQAIEIQELEPWHRREVRKRVNQLIRETDRDFARDRRREYLRDFIAYISRELAGLYRAYEESYRGDEAYTNRAMLAGRIQDHETVKGKHAAELKALNNPGGADREDFTMKVEKAKQRRFEEFIEVRGGRALCPFHDDRHPSFSVKNNRGRCFGCGWVGDVIDFVQARFGLGFNEAVDFLAG